MGNKTYLADFSTKGVQTVFIKNCKTKAQAKRKLLAFYAGTLSKDEEKDIEFINAEVTQSFPTAARFVEDRT